MRVDLLGLVLVQVDEAVEDVVAGCGIVVTTLVVGEVVLHGADGKLLLKPVDLVQEQDDRRPNKPPRVADGVEQRQGLLHTVDRLVLEQKLVVLGNGDQEEDGCDVLETVDPLLPLRPLATDVEHAVGQVADNERRLGDTRCLDTRAQHVLVVGHIIGGGDAGNVVEVARDRVSGWGGGGNMTTKQEKQPWARTYYRAESFSWYSRDRLKQSCTPRSFHRASMALPTSGGRTSPSI